MSLQYKNRKTAEIVDVVQLNGNYDEAEIFGGGDCEWRRGNLIVNAPNGAVYCAELDYLVRFPDGKLHALKPSHFASVYVRVGSAEEEALPDNSPEMIIARLEGEVYHLWLYIGHARSALLNNRYSAKTRVERALRELPLPPNPRDKNDSDAGKAAAPAD